MCSSDLDIPPSAYRPDPETGVEVSDAAGAAQPGDYDGYRGFRLIY